MKLDVQVSRKTVAQLYREGDEYVLKYLPGTDLKDFVSLSMPVRNDAWRWPRDLHPFFRQNLPEGYLLGIIREMFGPLLDGTDLSLLAVVGGAGIGRVSITPEGGKLPEQMEPLEIETLLSAENTIDHFESLVRSYARSSISGVVPKFIAPKSLPDPKAERLGKPTLRTNHQIVKGSDNNTPYLGFNEFYSMRVLERLNVVPVAKTRMSNDGRVLVVERFDVNESGISTHGLEDACSLLGLPPHEKYATTTERVLNATSAYLPHTQIRTQLEHLGWHLLLNYVIRNADCHAKNISLYYSNQADVCFTPVYDIVTTQAYPRFATSPPGLSIEGRQTWTPGKALQRFFNARLGIAPWQYAEMVERLCESTTDVGKEVIEAAKNDLQWRAVAKQMVHAWNQGMSALSGSGTGLGKGNAIKRLDTAIAAAEFSDPEPPRLKR